MSNNGLPNTKGQVYKLSEYIANSHLSFDVFGTIQRVFLLSNKMSSVLISVDDDSVIGISPSFISDTGNITPDTKIEVIPYSEWRKETADSFAYDYDRSRFTRSTLLETLRYKVRDHQRYSFVAHKHEDGSQESVVKYTFISLGKEAKFILATQQEITHNLEHDILTGGLNRAGLMRELQTKIEMSAATQNLVILFFNIQSFRLINELYGDEVGDKVLQYMYTAMVYSDLCPISYARMESDNFVCLVRKEYFDTEVITQLCHQECMVDHLKIQFRCLCGIYMVKDALVPPVTACNRAKLAMTYINDQYIKPWMIFEDYMQNTYFSDTEILKKFDDALDNNEFVPYYQPIVETSTGRVVMAEALVRWISPEHGIVSPAVFIPILERHGGLSRIDRLMENRIFQVQKRRYEQGLPVIPIDINISWVDFSDNGFVDQLFKHIEDPSLPNNLLRYEITESALSEIAENRLDVLSFFKKYGVEMLVDDFGQGYSFGTMKDMDFNYIKLDKSLIDRIGESRKVDFLIESLISMFHKMNAKIIAEGVETDLQVKYLRQVGCDYIQGFYYFKPIDENSFLALLEQQQLALEYSMETGEDIEPDSKQTQKWVDRDTLEQKYANLKQLLEEAKCLRMLLDEQDIHIFEWDVKTHVDKVSEKFRKMYNMPTDEVPNMPEQADLCFEEDRERFRQFYERAARGEQMGTDYFRLYNPDGKTYRWYRKTFYTLFDNEGFPYKAILSMQDCDDKYKLRLQKSRDLMLTKEQDIVTFIYKVPDDSFTFNYLNPQGEVASRTFSHFLENYAKQHNGTENVLAQMIKQRVNDINGPRSGFVDYYNGYTHTEQRAHYSKVDGEFGHLYAIIGQSEDINRTKERLTETIKAQNELLGLTESLRSIYNALSYIDLKTGESRILVLDKAYEGKLSNKMSWDTIATHYSTTLLKPQYRDEFLKFLEKGTMNERIGQNKYLSMEYEDTKMGWIRGFIIPSDRNEDGTFSAVFFASQPIGAEKSMMERLTYYSEIDGLTQIRNRYSGQREIAALLKQGQTGAFGILDCDKFKDVNDNYGHSVGDKLLVAIANAMKLMNPDGINLRLGGDEFSFFIPGKLNEEEIRTRMDIMFNYLRELKGDGLPPEESSLSVGVVNITTSAPIDFEALYHQGDTLMYQSKKMDGYATTIEVR